QRREGRPARSFAELLQAGMIRGIPVDPTGAPYIVGKGGKTAVGPGSKIDLWLLQQPPGAKSK
ncbi:MAG: hypothetical protein KGM47_02170, partial [Acidobacteriota bacterium]|nr:hypothetical protein [Acidobacteriota bacterium]